MPSVKSKNRVSKFFVIIFFGFLLAYILFKFVSGFMSGDLLIFADRVNVVFYGSNSYLVSFGLQDRVNYIAGFSHDHRVIVPGGYGRYRIGSLGGLAGLPEVKHDTDIVRRTFSSVISAYVDTDVYPKKTAIYDDTITSGDTFSRSSAVWSLFDGNYVTNASFLNKLILVWLLVGTNESDFVELSTNTAIEKMGEEIFSEEGYLKKYRGFFYHKKYRDESQEVKILYTNYMSALHLSRIIEGQGIRVVDLDRSDGHHTGCILYTDPHVQKKGNDTLLFLQRAFTCRVMTGKAQGANIILIPGRELEKKWE